MVGYLVKDCTDCGSLEDAICALDGVLAQYGRNHWQNTVYMTSKPTPCGHIKLLMYYRTILENLKWNQCFYHPFTTPEIVSRVKAITAGYQQIARRPDLSEGITTTTTSTSTTSTTSTSTSTTTSTSTSTTTTTSTTSTSTSTTTSTSTSTSSTSTTSTTSTTTTTTTTTLPELWVFNNATVGGAAILAITYDNYPPNNPQYAVGAYPVIAGDSKITNIQSSFIPGTFYISVDEDLFGCIYVQDSLGVLQCQNFIGLSLYTFTEVTVSLLNPVIITMMDVDTSCSTTSTTTTTTTT